MARTLMTAVRMARTTSQSSHLTGQWAIKFLLACAVYLISTTARGVNLLIQLINFHWIFPACQCQLSPSCGAHRGAAPFHIMAHLGAGLGGLWLV